MISLTQYLERVPDEFIPKKRELLSQLAETEEREKLAAEEISLPPSMEAIV
jgi:hypothetical protein